MTGHTHPSTEPGFSQVPSDVSRRRPASKLLFIGVLLLGGGGLLLLRPGAPEGSDASVEDGDAMLGVAVAVPSEIGLEDMGSLGAKLASADPQTRRIAAAALATNAEQARSLASELRKALHDTDGVVCAHAAHAVWNLERDSAAVLRLAELLRSGGDDVRRLAAYLLGNIGPGAGSALPSLRWEQQYNPGPLRLYAAEAIARIDLSDRPAVDTLLAGLRSGDADQRALAAFALGNVSDDHARRVIPVLRAAVHDQDLRVRTAAEVALSCLVPGTLAGVER